MVYFEHLNYKKQSVKNKLIKNNISLKGNIILIKKLYSNSFTCFHTFYPFSKLSVFSSKN
ncbi:hypothetical protein SPHINGO8BC_20021 [Sphingobacterium multivorum]|uniref:Uncharacterized protein n=1 Tax=Sphingobacterium multivorum TaxID=28454 RepID=A0A654B8B5_SPHMU|nr:hypothetical protein SPHINGO8BC_20021 [Sphingobacterium multivorum]